LAVLVPAAAQSPSLDVSKKALLDRATKYVTEYEKSFAFLVADETYEQVVRSGNSESRRRQLKSELFLTYLAGDGEWIALRDVLEVDNSKVSDRKDPTVLLTSSHQLRGLAFELVRLNARYNIGSVERNFNEPTLPLLLMEPKRAASVKFDRKHVTREGDTTLATLAFSESDYNTLVHSTSGPAPAKGEIVLDAATGVIRRTTFQIERRDLKASLETIYTEDKKLELWVPEIMRERYERTRGDRETIECEAKYTNYRRWDVTGRIRK